MRTQYFIYLLLLLSFQVTSQTIPDIVIDRGHKMLDREVNLYYLDTVGENYLTILSEADIDQPPFPLTEFTTKLKLISRTGEVFKVTQLPKSYSINKNCTRIGENYSIIINSNYQNRTAGTYIQSMLFDKNLNMLQDTTVNLGDDTVHLDRTRSNVTGQYLSIGDSTYFIVPMNARKDEVESNYFAVTVYGPNGFYSSARLIPINQSFDDISLRSPITISDANQYILPNKNYYNFFDSTFDLTEIKQPTLPYYTFFNHIQSVYSGGFIYLYSPCYFSLTEFKNIVLKLDPKLNVVDSLAFDQPFPISYNTFLLDHDVAPGCVFADEDGNLNAVSYYNGITGDISALPGRIFVSKFTPDMKVICQETYENPHWKMNLSKGLYLGNGQLLITGMMDSINSSTNLKKDYYPFIGLIKDGCELSWATRLEELKTNEEQIFAEKIVSWPNPASDRVNFKYEGDYNMLSTGILYNGSGKKLFSIPAWQSNTLDIDIYSFPTGIYFYSISNKLGQLYTGKIIKN